MVRMARITSYNVCYTTLLRGLKVLIDQVYAHSSDQHGWFAESRASQSGDKTDWYVWVDPLEDGTPPNNWQSVFGGPAWTWDARRGQYYLHTFLKEQPVITSYSIHYTKLYEESLGDLEQH